MGKGEKVDLYDHYHKIAVTDSNGKIIRIDLTPEQADKISDFLHGRLVRVDKLSVPDYKEDRNAQAFD